MQSIYSSIYLSISHMYFIHSSIVLSLHAFVNSANSCSIQILELFSDYLLNISHN